MNLEATDINLKRWATTGFDINETEEVAADLAEVNLHSQTVQDFITNAVNAKAKTFQNQQKQLKAEI